MEKLVINLITLKSLDRKLEQVVCKVGEGLVFKALWAFSPWKSSSVYQNLLSLNIDNWHLECSKTQM